MYDRCPYCMAPMGGEAVCPRCGKAAPDYCSSNHHLPPGTRLSGRYAVGRVLGEGGFGITYLGIDTKLDRVVAIKEYFPTAFVRREASLDLNVTCYTDIGKTIYEDGREKFLHEARIMVRLDNVPQIVQVLDYFSENSTAYIVMEYLEGKTLSQLKNEQGRLPVKALLNMLEPLFPAMSAMHKAGLIHRDISPDNFMCLKNGSIKLMDFGCARDFADGNTMTVVLKHGYAPLEQYTGYNQGPWTDVYSLCATLFYCLTGKLPPKALERQAGVGDSLIPPTKLGAALSREQERAILKGLAVDHKERWQSVDELYAALYGRAMPELRNSTETEPVRDAVPPREKKRRSVPVLAGVGAGALVAAVILLAALLIWRGAAGTSGETPPEPSQAVSADPQPADTAQAPGAASESPHSGPDLMSFSPEVSPPEEYTYYPPLFGGTVALSCEMLPPRLQVTDQNAIVTAITNFDAEKALLSCSAGETVYFTNKPMQMSDRRTWMFPANFYEHGTFLLSVRAFDSEGRSATGSIEVEY